MDINDVDKHIGQRVRVNGSRDLFFCGELRPIINNDSIELIIVKRTKRGLIYLQADKKFYAVPPHNVDLI